MDNEKVHNEKNATWIKSKLKTQTEKSATEKKTQRGKLKNEKVRCDRVKYENTTQE